MIDSHAHITADGPYEDLEGILSRAKNVGIEAIVNICTDKTTLERGVEAAKKYKYIYNTGATTPHDAKSEGKLNFPVFENAARNGQLVAIGETGLDYFYEHSAKEEQQKLLKRYFNLAKECNLPVVIHCRDAFEDLFSIAKNDFPKGKALLHCFTGTLDEAMQAIEMGWLISFSGIVTFKKSVELRKVLEEIPLNKIIIETDTPYLAPESKRGKANEPSFIKEIAQMISNVKKVSFEKVCESTVKNTKAFFSLS